jgi:hypothetical protein
MKSALSLYPALLVLLFSTVAHALSDQGIIGWDGDKNAGLAMMDGSIGIRGRPELDLPGPDLRWGIRGVGHAIAKELPASTKVDWINAEGWLPALVTRFEKDGCTITITNFCDQITLGGNYFVAAYSRVTIDNHSGSPKTLLPGQSPQFLIVRQDLPEVADKSTATHDFVIVIDRFGREIPWPDDESVRKYQTWDQAYDHMRSYWNGRLGRLLQIKHLPDPAIINQFKADYCHARIAMDGTILNAGEFGYDHTFSHDLISQTIHMFLMGEFDHAQEWLDGLIIENERVKNYPDATYKYSWPFALYLKLTDDEQLVRERFANIQRAMRVIASHRDGPDGLLGKTWALDNFGFWTLDNFSALQGLGCYAYICRRLGNSEELQWAEQQYQSLLLALEAKLTSLSPDKLSNRLDGFEPGGILFAFGCWPWDGYLWNLRQGNLPARIDASYDWLAKNQGFKSSHIWAEPWGGTPSHPAFFSVYSVGATSAMLRGTNWRGEGIRAFQFMLQNAQQGPLCYWECATASEESSWSGTHPHSGSGDCPHLFGPALSEKVLIESLITEKVDGTVIIGRGIPSEWCAPGQRIEISDAPVSSRRKIGFRMEALADRIEIELTQDHPTGSIWIDLPAFIGRKISSSSGRFDPNEHRMILPASARRAIFHLGSP